MNKVVKITDQIIKSVDRMTFYDLVDGSIMATINQLNSASINQTQETVWYQGKQGVKLAGFDRNKGVEVTAQNGYIDLATMSLQSGSEINVFDGATKFIEAPYLDEIVTDDGVSAETAYEAYAAVAGAEIEYIYKIHGSSIAGSTKYTQAAAVDATHFAYDPVTKTITLPTGVFDAGDVVLAQYKYKATGTSIDSDTEHFSKSAKVVIDITCSDICTDALSHAQFIIPKGKIDGNFGVQMGDNPAIHNVQINCTPSVCFGASKQLFTYQVINPYTD